MTNREAAVADLNPFIRDLMIKGGAVRDAAANGSYRESLAVLRELRETVAALEHGVLDVMRADRLTWQEIGAELGVSRQAAWERYRLAAS